MRLLLVDDDPAFRALLRTTFEAVDVEVDEAGSADVMTGASGHDWFILGSVDRITDDNSSARDGDRITRV